MKHVVSRSSKEEKRNNDISSGVWESGGRGMKEKQKPKLCN
jgi:hypothetical protein